MCMIGDEVV